MEMKDLKEIEMYATEVYKNILYVTERLERLLDSMGVDAKGVVMEFKAGTPVAVTNLQELQSGKKQQS